MIRILVSFVVLFAVSSGECPFGAVEGRWPYDCYVYKSVPRTFKDAAKVCANFGGLLTSLESAMESMLVNSFTEHYSGNYWVGLNYDDNFGNWAWTDRTSMNYTNWARGQPNSTTNGACASVDGSTRKWYVTDCLTRLPYICKVPPNDLPKPVVPTPPTSPLQCQPGWTYADSSNKCYKAYDGPALWRSWFGAVDRCRSQGGDLAMPKDSATNNAIDQVLQGNATGLFAIGLYSSIPCAPDDNACKWQWADGTPAVYTDWDPEDSYGRPRNVVGPDCAYFKQVQCYYTEICDNTVTDRYTAFFHIALEKASWGNGTHSAYRLIERCDMFSDSFFEYCEDGVECSVQIVNDIVGKGCEKANDTTWEAGSIRRLYEDSLNNSRLPGGSSDNCFHSFLIRYSNYSADMYESFVDTLGRYLLLELDMFGFCSPIAEATVGVDSLSDRRHKMHAAVRGIAKMLRKGKQLLEGEGAVKPKSWTQLAHEVARSAVDEVAKGKDLPYPSSNNSVETYEKIGESIRSFPFNTDTFSFDNVVYHPAVDAEEHCVLKYNNDTVEEVRYKNVNYVVSRCREHYESTKKNLCDRIEEVGSQLQSKFFGEIGFGTVVVVKCARKFVWLELAWKHFKAAWSSSEYQIFVNEGTYSSTCALIVFMP